MPLSWNEIRHRAIAFITKLPLEKKEALRDWLDETIEEQLEVKRRIQGQSPAGQAGDCRRGLFPDPSAGRWALRTLISLKPSHPKATSMRHQSHPKAC
jgi:hypothetical protein